MSLHKILAVVFTILSVACGDYTPLDQISNPIVGEIDTNGQPQELIDIVQEATDIWETHGISFVFQDGGFIRLHVAPYRYLASFSYREDDGFADVSFTTDEGGYGFDISCLAARYLGFAIRLPMGRGMYGLMGDRGYLTKQGQECPWTAEDQEKLCEYMGCDAAE